jgi:hypothetical protein
MKIPSSTGTFHTRCTNLEVESDSASAGILSAAATRWGDKCIRTRKARVTGLLMGS